VLAKQYTALHIQANTLAALWAPEKKGFDEVREVEKRLAAAKKHDLDKGGQAAGFSGHLCRRLRART
jgi:hypothetical protein